MPISTLWAKSMPSIFSRKACTKCWRDCSPSVTMSMPKSSCSFSHTSVASRLARSSASPEAFHGAQRILGSASHSGFGKEPAMVVGNSMEPSRFWLIEPFCAMSYAQGTEQQKSSRQGAAYLRGNHDRPALCADAERLENLDHAGGARASLSGDP